MTADGVVRGNQGRGCSASGLTGPLLMLVIALTTRSLFGQCCPPTITTQPESRTNTQGTTATFWVIVNSATTVTYQWSFNGASISGGTATNYAIGNVQPSNAGSYQVVAVNSAGAVTSSVATLTVMTSPGTLQFSSSSYSLSESIGMASITVSRTGGSAGTVSVNYSTTDGTATNGVDYTAISGTLTFSNGVTSKTFNVPIIDDNRAEGDRTFSVRLSNVSGATLGTLTNSAVKIVDNDSVAAWGASALGQLSVPAGLTNVMAIAGGGDHSLVLRSNGTVVAWGDNSFGQTNIPADLTNAIAITAGDKHSVALRSNGTVVAWGDDTYDQLNIPAGLSNVVAISAGGWHTLALESDGTVVAWGTDGDGQIDVPSGLTDVVAVAGGGWHSLALRRDGTLVGWGLDFYNESDIPAGLSNVVAIAAGSTHNVVLKNDGKVTAWGGDYSGQSDVPAGLPSVAMVAAGREHSVALTRNGAVICWGDNTYGQTNSPPALTNVVSVASRGDHSLGLRNNGSLVITVQPLDRTAAIGSSVQLSFAAVGAPIRTYQWKHYGTNIGPATFDGATGLVPVTLTGATNGPLTYFQCHISPSSATNAGAAWRLQGEPSYHTDWNYIEILTTNTVVEFKPVPGWVPPTNSSFIATRGQANLVLATYTVAATNWYLTNIQPQDAGTYTVVANNGFGAVTSAPAVITIQPMLLLTSRALTTTGFLFQVTGPPGTFLIDASPDLTSWTTLTSMVVNTSSFSFTDPAATGLTHRFYRVRQ